MKVAILLLNKGRGSGVVAREHVTSLLRLGHEVYFMHPDIGAGVDGATNINIELNHSVFPVHEYLPTASKNQKAVSRMNYDEAMAYIPCYKKALESIIDKVDIIIGHHANLTAIATANVARHYHTPYVIFVHGTGIEPRHNGHYDDKVWEHIRDAIEGANGVIVTTEYVRDNLVRTIMAIPEERFLIHPCGVDLEEFNPNNIANIREKYKLPKKYAICPGALIHGKGPQNVVKASKVYADLIDTIFIGDGELRKVLTQEIGNRGRLLGYVSNEDKAKLINAATLVVAAPEKKEHFGIIYVEALAAGTPVVAYGGGGVNTIITPDTGILTERDPDILGETIRQLLLDEVQYNHMVKCCIARAQEIFDQHVLGPKLAYWLEQIITQNRKEGK